MQQSLSVENKVKKERLIFVKKIQDSDDKQYKTLEIEVPERVDLVDYDIIGGEWFQVNNKGIKGIALAMSFFCFSYYKYNLLLLY